jgi:hypothetical protein
VTSSLPACLTACQRQVFGRSSNLGCDFTLSWSPSAQLWLDVSLRELHSWWNAINHTANTLAMGFTKGGHAKEGSKVAHRLSLFSLLFISLIKWKGKGKEICRSKSKKSSMKEQREGTDGGVWKRKKGRKKERKKGEEQMLNFQKKKRKEIEVKHKERKCLRVLKDHQLIAMLRGIIEDLLVWC